MTALLVLGAGWIGCFVIFIAIALCSTRRTRRPRNSASAPVAPVIALDLSRGRA